MTRDEAFVEYATADAAGLRRMAYLLCHDWHLAEDLTQTALTKTYLMWRRNGPPQVPHAYARTVLTRTFIDHRRRRGSSEYATDALPELTESPDPSLRMTLIEALRALPPRDRAIVVLRYWEDLPVEQVAQLVGVSTAVVRSQSARSLARLRPLVAELDRLTPDAR